MTKRLSLLLAIFSVVMSLAMQPASAAPASGVALLLGSMNLARVAEHLSPLHLDSRLNRVAYAHALDMVRRHYIEHETPEGQTPFDRLRDSHIRFGYAAENVALDDDARTVYADFWSSLEHRSNMLGEHYVRVGIASIQAPNGTVVVEDFSD